MARGKKRNGKREQGKGYGAINPNGGTDIDSSSGTAAVTGGNGANDRDEENGDGLSVLLDEIGGALVVDSIDDEEKREKEEFYSEEVMQGEEMGKDGGGCDLIF